MLAEHMTSESGIRVGLALADLLAPMPPEEFFGEFWARRVVQIPGAADKFTPLFSWPVLNRALEQHHFQPNQLSLVKEGRPVSPALYLAGTRVNAEALLRELAQGATLILNYCDEVHPPLRNLCRSLERLFHVDVQTNVYAGWRTDNGFNVHWDDQDNLILQVAGRKRWKVWEPTRSCPFKRDVVDTSPATKPAGPPIWEGVLEPGSLLNIPRGWWHVAYPLDEPCLHLTVTVATLTGIGLLQWLAHEMKTSDAARQPVPIIASEEERRAWLNEIWRDLSRVWRPDLVTRYLAHVDKRAQSARFLKLPDLAAVSMEAVGPSTPLQLTLPRPLGFQITGSTARIFANDMEWQTTSNLVPLLDAFNDGLPHTIADLVDDPSAKVPGLVVALAMKGILRPARS